jgi:hypothetical protein
MGCFIGLVNCSIQMQTQRSMDRLDQPIQWQRLHLIANTSRFLILPGHHVKNLASKILSLNLKRLSADWERHRMISILAISICAVLCGARGYAAIAEFAKLRIRKQLKKLRCRYDERAKTYIPPSEPTIGRVLQSCDVEKVDQALFG